jgi:5-methylcytosine-specific restriction endonuclease McrA
MGDAMTGVDEYVKEMAQSLKRIEGLLDDLIASHMGSVAVFRTTYHDKRKGRKERRPGKHTREQWQALKAFYDFTCLRCGRKEPEITLTRDHIDPKGTNDISNIQPVCIECNDIKGDAVKDYRPTTT